MMSSLREISDRNVPKASAAGVLSQKIYADQDDPTQLFYLLEWTSREDQVAYMKRRWSQPGAGEEIEALFAKPSRPVWLGVLDD